MKAQQLNNENQPTICTYTLINAPSSSLPCAKFSDDSQILATGYENSTIQVWNISNKISNGLKTLKKELNPDLINPSLPIEELENIIFEPEREFTKILSGHTNTVSSIDLLYDNSLMISSSYDCTIRLWSLNLWDILTLYKGHLSPVLDLSFGPFGHYFASCGSDRISRLWSVEQSKTLRLFSGHSSDVSKVKFHPNTNYILTGSDDCSICLWDVLSGKKERDLVFHRSAITALTISSDGKMCASGDSTGSIFISDLSAGKVLGKFQLKGSSKRYTADESIIDIKFGRENSCIAASGLNNKVIVASLTSSDTKNNVSPEVLESIGTFRTKKTPITELHFTYNNLILGVGAFNDY
ncbi:MAG: Transcription initiation factor TFIID subunit 5 [Paramarteilia canceri]